MVLRQSMYKRTCHCLPPALIVFFESEKVSHIAKRGTGVVDQDFQLLIIMLHYSCSPNVESMERCLCINIIQSPRFFDVEVSHDATSCWNVRNLGSAIPKG